MKNEIAEYHVKKYCNIMDEVFKKHIGSNIAPYFLTNKEEILAILLGMGHAKARMKSMIDRLGFEFVVETDFPCSIFWNGEKFEIHHEQGAL